MKNDMPPELQNLSYAVEMRDAHDLKPNPKNPRRHKKHQIKQLVKAIRIYGFTVPVLIDRDDQIVAGHGRVEAAKMLGCKVPTIRHEHLTPAQAAACCVADNRLSDLSDWDEVILKDTFELLTRVELDFDLPDATGFSVAEIDRALAGPVVAKKVDAADFVPPTAAGKAVSMLGDLWILGDHRVLCGNSLETASYECLLKGQKASAICTDAPFNVPIKGHVSGLGSIEHREFSQGSGELSPEEFKAFLKTLVKRLVENSVDGSLHYHFMDWRSIATLVEAGLSGYSELKNIAVWSKDRAGMGSLYRSQHELCAIFKCGHAPHRNNVELGRYGRHRTNVWKYPSISTERHRSEEGDLLALHPTVKPVALFQDIVLDCTARGEIVLDPFLGSGTSVIACQRSGRHCAGIELDPLYVDVIVRRWQDFTGQDAVLEGSGQTFHEINLIRSVS